MEDIILFHGSRGGIKDNIKPISRDRCDFGKGFYMGQDSRQAKALIINDSDPCFYTLKLKLSEIPENRILNLKDDKEWLYTILANREKVKEFNELNIAKEIKNKCKDYDIIIGPIADDKMNEALARFSNYTLTDKGLIACMKCVDFGCQYVAKTEFACSKIEILDEKSLYGVEAKNINDYAYNQRNKCNDIVKKMIIQYRNNGLYLDEIIEQEKNKQNLNKYQVNKEEDNEYELY